METRKRIYQAIFITMLFGIHLGLNAQTTAKSKRELQLSITETRTLRSAEGRYFGRASLQILKNGTWVMTYINSDHHWRSYDGQIEVMFSEDEGRTWTEPNTYTNGKPVKGLPGAPSPKESVRDPIESYIYLAPNGDLLISAMDRDMATRTSYGADFFARSTDNGKTWGPWIQTSQNGVPYPFFKHYNDMTQQCFVKDGIMYASSRATDMRAAAGNNNVPALFKSADNGKSWTFVNFIGKVEEANDDLYRSADSESGITLVGPNEIVAVLRHGMWPAPTHTTRSYDMGKTWTEAEDVSAKTDIWKRARIYTLKQLRHLSGAEDIPDWWDDDVLIGTGLLQVTEETRNVCLWYSLDKGNTWSSPFRLDQVTQDAGYGDLRMRKNGELVVVSYYGEWDEADIKQYVVSLELVK